MGEFVRGFEIGVLAAGLGLSYGAAVVYSLDAEFYRLWGAALGFAGWQFFAGIRNAIR